MDIDGGGWHTRIDSNKQSRWTTYTHPNTQSILFIGLPDNLRATSSYIEVVMSPREGGFKLASLVPNIFISNSIQVIIPGAICVKPCYVFQNFLYRNLLILIHILFYHMYCLYYGAHYEHCEKHSDKHGEMYTHMYYLLYYLMRSIMGSITRIITRSMMWRTARRIVISLIRSIMFYCIIMYLYCPVYCMYFLYCIHYLYLYNILYFILICLYY